MKIEVDFEVYKELTARRTAEEVTENDVIRELLNLEKKEIEIDKDWISDLVNNLPNKESWVSKGVEFPQGTKFRASYKGKEYFAEVKQGMLYVPDLGGFSSPSRAAMAITQNSVNGWKFWECKRPKDVEWKVLSLFRK